MTSWLTWSRVFRKGYVEVRGQGCLNPLIWLSGVSIFDLSYSLESPCEARVIILFLQTRKLRLKELSVQVMGPEVGRSPGFEMPNSRIFPTRLLLPTWVPSSFLHLSCFLCLNLTQNPCLQATLSLWPIPIPGSPFLPLTTGFFLCLLDPGAEAWLIFLTKSSLRGLESGLGLCRPEVARLMWQASWLDWDCPGLSTESPGKEGPLVNLPGSENGSIYVCLVCYSALCFFTCLMGLTLWGIDSLISLSFWGSTGGDLPKLTVSESRAGCCNQLCDCKF